jgi:hypothetical protein
MKRVGAFALALLYTLPSTWALQGGIDLLRPKQVARPDVDGKCAPHGCGCEESAQRRNACCCIPVAGPAGPSSAIEASRCAGTEAAIQNLLTPPALPALQPNALPPAVISRVSVPVQSLHETPESRPSEKVPIA